MTAAGRPGRLRLMGAISLTMTLAACPGAVPDDLRRPAQAGCEVVITNALATNIGYQVYDDDGLLRIEERSQDLDRGSDISRSEFFYKEGRLARSVRSGRSTVFDYDGDGRLIEQRQPGSTERWEYDQDRLMLYTNERRDSPLITHTYVYGGDGRLATRTESEDDRLIRSQTFEWTDDQTAEAVDSIANIFPAGARTFVRYDEAGRLLSERVDADDNGTIEFGFTQVWHDATRLARKDTEFGLVERWEYDEQDRLAIYRWEPFLGQAQTEISEWTCL